MKRYFTFAIIALVLGTALSANALIHKLSGNFKGTPAELRTKISPQALHWMDSTLAQLDSHRVVDIHTHMIGTGRSTSGIWTNPTLYSWKHPKKHAQFLAYMSAGGMNSIDSADQQYWRRLQELSKDYPAKGQIYLFAFDGYYTHKGKIDSSKSEFIVPNAYVWQKAQENPAFVPVISINPYRKDALAELDQWGQKGVKMIKWLPNAMGIDPADSALTPFYAKMRQYDITLITHAGEEQAVDAKEDQKWGNPLRLRLPLDQGVRVILAHCASLGMDEDLDQKSKPIVSSSALFARMMADSKYQNLLYGDLSAVTQVNRFQEILPLIFAHPEWHERLINGSDYPLPAVNALFNLSSLERQGYLSKSEKRYLKEIYAYNPLLFDLLLKLSIHDPKTGQRLNKKSFYRPFFLEKPNSQ